MDGKTFGFVSTAQLGGAPLLDSPVTEWPWWWTTVLLLERRFASIRELAVTGFDKKPPPKDFWLDDELIASWQKDQEALRKANA